MNRLVDRLAAEGRTLVVRDGAELDGKVRRFCEAHNVGVRPDESLSTDECRIDAGGETVASGSVSTLSAYVGRDPETVGTDGSTPQLVEAFVGGGSAVESWSVERMVRLSREIERRAWTTGDGRLRSGFQMLSAFAGDTQTRNRYVKIVDAGVDVAVYGVPDTDPPDGPYRVVTDDDGTLADYWFVLYDGGGRDGATAALVTEEVEDGRFGGYWTTTPSLVDDLFELAREDHPDLFDQ